MDTLLLLMKIKFKSTIKSLKIYINTNIIVYKPTAAPIDLISKPLCPYKFYFLLKIRFLS